MYLSDEELAKLAANMLEWLRDDGYLFFRESCYHSSGDMKNSDNPTVYRTPQMYTDIFSGVKKQNPNGDITGFEVVTKRSVDAYAEVCSNNINTRCGDTPKRVKDSMLAICNQWKIF